MKSTRWSLLVLMLLSCTLSVAAAKPVTTVTVENTSGKDRPPGPVTFGAFFTQGDLKDSVAVDGLPTQANVKRRWPDGSIKHAVLTVSAPALPAGGSKAMPLVSAKPVEAERSPGMPKLPDLKVSFRIHNGPVEVASLRTAAEQDAKPRRWLTGSQAAEWLLKTVPANAETGKQDPELEVRFRVRYFPATESIRVVVVVENCKWASAGSIPYDVRISVGDKELFAQKEVGRWGKDKTYKGHTKWTRWVKRFWFGRKLDDVLVRYDREYIFGTALLPRYDPKATVSAKSLAKLAGVWAKAEKGPLQRGTITAYFGTTGGRSEIGPLPGWTAAYLISQDPRPGRVTFGAGDLSGSCPIHIRDEKTDWILSIDKHPTYSLNNRGTKERMTPRDRAETPYVLDTPNNFSVDAAHQGSFAYVPYLLTGDYYYLEEMEFWAAYNMVKIHYKYRQQDKGLLTPNQVRGVGWVLRNNAHAAALAPDGSPGKDYFESKLANTLRYLSDWAASPKASPLGIYLLGAGHSYTRGWPRHKEWEKNWWNRYYSLPPWQHNFLTWCVAHVADLGYDDAIGFRDYMMKFTIGIATHPDEINPHAGASYFIFVGERRKDGTVWWYDTWKDVQERTYHAPRYKPRAEPTASKGEYLHAARGVLIYAMRAGLDGAREAFEWTDRQQADLEKHFQRDPKWVFEVPAKKPGK